VHVLMHPDTTGFPSTTGSQCVADYLRLPFLTVMVATLVARVF
jgi:hypothetical protein